VKAVVFIILFLSGSLHAVAQVQELEVGGNTLPTSSHDPDYIDIFPEYITTRLYFSQKITNVDFFDDNFNQELTYDPNTTLNLGIGATVNGFTLNLAYGFDFLNPEEGRGRTRYLDLQSYTYTRKSVIDFFGQFYNGLYLNNTAEQLPNWKDPFYVRPDMRLRLFGISYLHLFNGEKFSYAAPFVHNEVQKKSAGSFLLGGDFTLVYASGDSTMVSPLIDDSLFSPLRGLQEVAYFDLGPKVGYAHTFIFLKHMFATLSLSVGIGVGPTRYTYEGGRVENQWLINPSANIRLGFGYNSPDWYLGLTAVQSTFQNAEFETNNGMVFGVGNVRLNYVKRFKMGPKTKRFIDKIPLL
jgi:hypothetical protein